MKNQKMYEADDKMISLIRDNYDLLQSLGSFGISISLTSSCRLSVVNSPSR